MPEKKTLRRAREDKAEGKSASTQAGEFVREEMEHIRRGQHGARSPQQAIAIGLSKARRAGVQLKPPAPGKAKPRTRRQAQRDLARGRASGDLKSASAERPKNPRRSRATSSALKREGRSAASRPALAKQAHAAAQRRHRRGKVTSSSRRAA